MANPKILLLAAMGIPSALILSGDYFKNVPGLGYIVNKLPTFKDTFFASLTITFLEPIIEGFVTLGDKPGERTAIADGGKALSILVSINTGAGKTQSSKYSMGDFYSAIARTLCKVAVKTASIGGYVDLFICEPVAESFSLAEKDRKKESPIEATPSSFYGFTSYAVSDSQNFLSFYSNKLLASKDLIARSLLTIISKAGPVGYVSDLYEQYGLRAQLNLWAKVPLHHTVHYIANLKITSPIGPHNVFTKIPIDVVITAVSIIKNFVETLIFRSVAAICKNVIDDTYAIVGTAGKKLSSEYTPQLWQSWSNDEVLDTTIDKIRAEYTLQELQVRNSVLALGIGATCVAGDIDPQISEELPST